MGIHEGHAAGYQIIDHEADTGFIVFAHRYEGLFTYSARALFSLITNLRKVRKGETKEVLIPLEPDSLIIFLNELLYLWDADRFITKTVAIRKEGSALRCAAQGEHFDRKRHIIKKEVKAATYHGFSIEFRDGLYRARFIVDI
ncbi:MAG: hypothetical protein C0392_06290 [Syntrophus sp. (in: bacteria)]|nr:hypothetical protein [Syntrophus sp. (in: bacteria)]